MFSKSNTLYANGNFLKHRFKNDLAFLIWGYEWKFMMKIIEFCPLFPKWKGNLVLFFLGEKAT
jgi:hypothetical protein